MELLRTPGGLWHGRKSLLFLHCDSHPGPLRATASGSGLAGVRATPPLVVKGLSVTLLEAISLSLPLAESSIEREITLPLCLTGVKKPWIRSPKPRKAPQPPWTAEDSQEKVLEMVEAIALLPPSSPIALSLDPWVGRITRVHLVSCMRELGMRQKVDHAMELYRWMEMQQRRLKPTAHALTLILTILGRSGLPQSGMICSPISLLISAPPCDPTTLKPLRPIMRESLPLNTSHLPLIFCISPPVFIFLGPCILFGRQGWSQYGSRSSFPRSCLFDSGATRRPPARIQCINLRPLPGWGVRDGLEAPRQDGRRHLSP